MKFELIGTDTGTKARAGIMTTDHGVIETPIFYACWDSGKCERSPSNRTEQEINPDVILGNTYHLYLRPSIPILEQAGGLHRFMN